MQLKDRIAAEENSLYAAKTSEASQSSPKNREMHLSPLASQKNASRAKESFIRMQLIKTKLHKFSISKRITQGSLQARRNHQKSKKMQPMTGKLHKARK
jgi:hypothetical protein